MKKILIFISMKKANNIYILIIVF